MKPISQAAVVKALKGDAKINTMAQMVYDSFTNHGTKNYLNTRLTTTEFFILLATILKTEAVGDTLTVTDGNCVYTLCTVTELQVSLEVFNHKINTDYQRIIGQVCTSFTSWGETDLYVRKDIDLANAHKLISEFNLKKIKLHFESRIKDLLPFDVFVLSYLHDRDRFLRTIPNESFVERSDAIKVFEELQQIPEVKDLIDLYNNQQNQAQLKLDADAQYQRNLQALWQTFLILLGIVLVIYTVIK